MVVARRGQVFFFTLMVGIVVAILALALAPATRQVSEDAKNVSSDTAVGLDCTNSSISDFDKGTCLFVDVAPAYFFWGMLGLVGIVIGAKVMLG